MYFKVLRLVSGAVWKEGREIHFVRASPKSRDALSCDTIGTLPMWLILELKVKVYP